MPDNRNNAVRMRRAGPRPDPEWSLQATLALLEQKWTMAIVLGLLQERRRFTELAQCTPGLNTRTLTERLRSLEQLGIVSRHESEAPRRSVEYSLTPKGRELRLVLRSIARWGRRWMGALP